MKTKTVLPLIALISLGATPGGPDPTAASTELTLAPPAQDIVAIVAKLLARYHYSEHPIDDELSDRWLHNYLDDLDPDRSVFLQSDIAEFEQHRTQLDDDLRARPPRLDLATTLYERFRERLREREQDELHLLDQPLDLTNDESFAPDRPGHEPSWPATRAEAGERRRQEAENELIGDLLDAQNHDTAEEIQARLRMRCERALDGLDAVEPSDVLLDWLEALATSFDPHSAWFPPPRQGEEDDSSAVGIGASLRQDGDFTVFSDVVAGGPADQARRIRVGDRILTVGSSAGEPVDVVGMSVVQVVRLIRGPEGSRLALHLEHADGTRESVEVVRGKVGLVSPIGARLEQVGGRKLGVVELPSFYHDSTGRASEDLRHWLIGLEGQGMQGAILDLRGNHGGSLLEAVAVAGLFLQGGPVVQLRDRKGHLESLPDPDWSVAWSGPLVVLTDAATASASEIVAGALQDYGRAVIVGGATTAGAGTVQQVVPLDELLRRPSAGAAGELKITVEQFYRVSGGSIQQKGVESDLELPSPGEGLQVREPDREYALPWDQVSPVRYTRAGDLAALLPELRSRSEARRASSAAFQRFERVRAARAELAARPVVSLSLEQRRTELEALDARIGEPVPGDFVLDETLSILGDLVDLRR